MLVFNKKKMVDFVSILIVLAIIAIIYFLFLKPSSDAVSTNVKDITTVLIPQIQKNIQDSIQDVKTSLASQDVNIKDIKGTLIPELTTKINKSIDDLGSSVSAQNKQFTASLDTLKTALDGLTKSSNDSIASIQLKLNNLDGAFKKFVEVTVADIKRIDEKATKDYSVLDGKITLLSTREVEESRKTNLAVKELSDREIKESTRIDAAIKALTDREVGESTRIDLAIKLLGDREVGESTRIDAAIKALSDRGRTESTRIDLAIAALTEREAGVTTRLDAAIKALSEREQLESSRLDRAIAELRSREAEDSRLIRALIAQEQADLDALSRKFPELSTSIEEVKRDSFRNFDKLHLRLEENQSNDNLYNYYVDTINKYIDDAMTDPEISQKIKKRIFKTPDSDYFKQYIKFDTFETRQKYLRNIFTKVTKCVLTTKETVNSGSRILNETISNMLANKENVDELVELIWLMEAGRHYEAGLLESSGQSYSGGVMPVRYDVKTNEFYRSSVEDNQFMTSFDSNVNKVLTLLGLPPVINSRYSYDNTKTAVIQSIKNMVFDCNNWMVKLGQNPEDCERMNSYWKSAKKCYVSIPAENSPPEQISDINSSPEQISAPEQISEVAQKKPTVTFQVSNSFPALIGFTESDNRRVTNFETPLQPGNYSKCVFSFNILDMSPPKMLPQDPKISDTVYISIVKNGSITAVVGASKTFINGSQPIVSVYEVANTSFTITGDEQILIAFLNEKSIPNKRYSVIAGTVTMS
jgi:hypothetical protein